ncbi:predicted protein [Uncinocarpus reesii 1704]|uniref:Secreted protein n=1 Tax=Uncinocarpus reesii (strain UAMH 1704) TaxID=336963 RepID=C4JID1_UNCRE|nr:uncharacterized protein UREG_02877 [Uncinocarpus reesii 1704]EEP78028.1 predicted protein [Uncinocarpus reesii 1704]
MIPGLLLAFTFYLVFRAQIECLKAERVIHRGRELNTTGQKPLHRANVRLGGSALISFAEVDLLRVRSSIPWRQTGHAAYYA